MLHNILTISALYLIACGVAWALHELAHYAVHSLYAESVTLGMNRRGPYVDAVYHRTAPPLAVRVGSVAPTLIYTPLLAIVLLTYLQSYSPPALDAVGWSLVLIPILILVTPTGTDLHRFVHAHR